MYWYLKIKKYALPSLLLSCSTLGLLACGNEESSSIASAKTSYYPIHQFFSDEVSKLKIQNPIVDKTVWKEKESENQKLTIKNWEEELGNFLSVDLNKPAYDQQFQVDTLGDTIRYRAINSELEIQLVELVFNAAKIPQRISIRKSTNNTLYSNVEELVFEPGKYYTVKKEQTILLLGKNKYQIEGKIN